MKSKRLKFFAAGFALLLAAQVLLPGRSSAAKVMEQLPKPEWSYTLPDGLSFWGTIDTLQSKQRMFIPLVKTVTVSPGKTKSSGMLYSSLDRINGSANWVYDYSDMANDKPFTANGFILPVTATAISIKCGAANPMILPLLIRTANGNGPKP